MNINIIKTKKYIINKKRSLSVLFFLLSLLVSGTYWLYSHYDDYLNQILSTEYMQNKIWFKVNKHLHNYSFHDLNIKTYRKYDSEHFTIFFKTIDLNSVQIIARSAEKIYKPVCEKMTYNPKLKPQIVIVPNGTEDYNEFAGLIRLPDKIINETIATPETIISHEFTHIINRELTRENLVTWLDEGIAVYIETFISGKERFNIEDKKYDYTYHIDELENNFSNIPGDEGYCQAYITVKFITTHYDEETLLKIINELKDERITEEKLFIKYLGLNYKELYQKLVDYKKELRESQKNIT